MRPVHALAFVAATALAGVGHADAPRRPAPPVDVAVSAAERSALVIGVLHELDTKFVFPEVVERQRGELQKRWSTPAFTQLASANQLIAAINADLAALFHDRHLRLVRAEALPPGMLDGAAPDAPPTAAEIATMEAFEARGHFGIPRVEVLDGNIGYIEIVGFPNIHFEGETRAIADAMSFVGDTRALILDLRRNHGGDGESVALLMSYLLDGRKLLLNEWDRITGKTHEDWTLATVTGRRYGAKRPLWVLTSRDTFSAGEECAYDVQTLKRGTLVGEATGGGANHNLFVRVGAHFALSVPFGTVKSPITGANWEGVGVKPDVAVAGDAALDTALAAARKQLGPLH